MAVTPVTDEPFVRDATVSQPVPIGRRTEPLIPVSWQLKWLLEVVGEKIVAAATGSSSAKTVRDWATDELAPTVDDEDRLALLFQTAFIVEFRYDDETAQAFLISANDYLDGASPVALIRTEVPQIVEPRLRTAVKDFVER
jgi:hypothetical protein